jgi:hypothetical protein
VALPDSAVYGIGFVHPLVFTFVAYLFFVLFRSVYGGIKKVVGK